MVSKAKFFLFLFPLVLLLCACVPECTIEEYATFFPILESPANESLISYENPPTLDWTHQEKCSPLYYQVSIKDLITNEITKWLVEGVDTESKITHYQIELEPNREYEWSVIPFSQTVENDQYLNIFGNRSQIFNFTTNGLCSSAAEIAQPISTYPVTGTVLGEGEGPGAGAVDIRWQYPGDCFAESYHYQVAADPGFTNIITTGNITDGSLQAKISVPWCAKVYWRVQGKLGNEGGENSEPSNFIYASSSNCLENLTSSDPFLIKGYVFEDFCAATVPWVPDGVGIAPPCIFGEPYGVHADGVRARVKEENEMTGEMDPAEIGIEGVVVDLGAGPCPATGLDQFTTMENGNYYFIAQASGEYCLSIDKSNNPDFDHGIWTLPLTDQDVTETTISINLGDDLVMQNFGWDKNDFIKVDFLVDLTSFCRFGDSKYHQPVTEVPAGAIIPIYARNEEATWFATFMNGMRCFISVASGIPAEDPTWLMRYPDQPDPQPPADPSGSPEDQTSPTSDPCANNTSERYCIAAGCIWHQGTRGVGYCSSD